MTSALPHCSLVSPYFPEPSVGRANAAASKIDAWSTYASQSLGTTPESGPSSPTPMEERQKNQRDVASTGNSDFLLRNPSIAATANSTSASFQRDKANAGEGDETNKLQQIIANLRIRHHTDVYKNHPSSCPSPNLSTIGEMQSHANISSPLSLSTQPRSLCAYNRQVYDATRSLYGTPRATHRPTQLQRQYATSVNAPFLAGSRTYGYLNEVSDDYSPDMLSPQIVSNLENLISSPVPCSVQRLYEQPNERNMLPGQLEGSSDYAWFLSQNRPDNAHLSGNFNSDQVPYYGRPRSSTSDNSSSSLSSPASGTGKQTTSTVLDDSNPSAWGFDAQAYLVDPLDGRHYGIAEEILAQQLAYPVSHAPPNPDVTENFSTHYNQVFHTTGPYTDAKQQVPFASNVFSRNNKNLHSLAISTSGLNTQISNSMTSSPLPLRRGSFDGDFSIFNASKSAVVGGPYQTGSHLYTQHPHQRRHSVSSNPPLSAASSSSSTACSITNQSLASGGAGSTCSKDPKKLSLYKTELCRSFEETGSCRYGNKCQFAHGQEELRTVERHPKHKSVMCKTFWEQGSCPYGQRCCFIHTAVPSDRGTVSIQSRTQFQSAPPSGASHSLPAKPPAVASSAIPTGNHKRQPSGSLASLYPVEDDAVIDAITMTADTRKLTKGPSAPTFSSGYVRSAPPTSGLPDKPTLGSTAVGSSSMQRRLRRASLGDAEDAGLTGLLVPTMNNKGKQSQCACSRIGGDGSCFSCLASSNLIGNQAKTHSHLRSRTITSGELAYQQQQQQHHQQEQASRTARRSSLTETGARRLPIFQSIQS